MAELPEVVAIGETGLDNYRRFSASEVQEAFFREHLELAARLGLPVVVHHRDASARTLEILMCVVQSVLPQN